jgi:hypothetical protein
MSLGYAERLSYREDLGGRLGAPEILEHAQEVLQKVEQFTDLVRTGHPTVLLRLPLPWGPTSTANNAFSICEATFTGRTSAPCPVLNL